MEKSKMTKKEWFAILRAMVGASTYEDKEGAYAFIDHEVELLSKKASKSTNDKKKVANENLKNLICEVLADFGKPVTIAELLTVEDLKNFDAEKPMTNQRLSAMLTQLGEGNEKVVGEGKVRKTYEKKVPYFELV